MLRDFSVNATHRMKIDVQAWMQSGAILSISQEQLLIGYGCYEWKAQTDLQQNLPAFYFPDFFLENLKPWIQFAHWQIITPQELGHMLNSPCDLKRGLEWHCPYRDLFYQTFDQLQKEFATSLLTKAIPYVFSYTQESMTFPSFIQAIKKALAYITNYPSYLYGFWSQNDGMLGVTPEVLFSCQGKSLQTMALAGTSPKQDKFGFLNHFKESQEHKLVIKGIEQSLSEVGVAHIGETQVLELPTLNHLWTPIHVALKQEMEFNALVQCLHPTPALGTFPKAQGWQWLKQYQQRLNRGRYGAPAGILYAKEHISHCLVAIRNVQWTASHMRIGAGCGIIKESNRDSEWKEIQLKIHATQELFGL